MLSWRAFDSPEPTVHPRSDVRLSKLKLAGFKTFVDPTTVVTVVEDDPADENYAALQENLERLRGMRDQDGRPLTIETLPMPRALHHEGQRLPASYANFYIANGLVLLPTYDPGRDEEAKATLARLFPGRDVVGIDCTNLVWGLGAFHCVTQQWPAENP